MTLLKADIPDSRLTAYSTSEIILPALLLVVFQVGKNGGPGPDGKVVGFVVPERNNGDPHFPAMQVAVQVEIRGGELTVENIISRIEPDLPLGGQLDVS